MNDAESEKSRDLAVALHNTIFDHEPITVDGVISALCFLLGDAIVANTDNEESAHRLAEYTITRLASAIEFNLGEK